MSKRLIVVSAFALATALGASGAQAGSRSSNGGLLGLNFNLGNVISAKANVGGSSAGHSSSDLLGLDVKVGDVATVKAAVGSTNPRQGLVNADVNVGGGRQIDDHSAFDGHEGGVGGW